MDDQELIDEHLRTGDPAAFRAIVERYQRLVFRVASAALGPRLSAEAEDVAQEVFLQLHRSLGQFRGESKLASWIYRMTYNRALDYRRRARHRLPHVSDAVLAESPAVAAFARKYEIGEAVDALPDLYRTLVLLYYWHDCSLAEIQEITGIVPGTAKSYLARARAMMEARLEA